MERAQIADLRNIIETAAVPNIFIINSTTNRVEQSSHRKRSGSIIEKAKNFFRSSKAKFFGKKFKQSAGIYPDEYNTFSDLDSIQEEALCKAVDEIISRGKLKLQTTETRCAQSHPDKYSTSQSLSTSETRSPDIAKSWKLIPASHFFGRGGSSEEKEDSSEEKLNDISLESSKRRLKEANFCHRSSFGNFNSIPYLKLKPNKENIPMDQPSRARVLSSTPPGTSRGGGPFTVTRKRSQSVPDNLEAHPSKKLMANSVHKLKSGLLNVTQCIGKTLSSCKHNRASTEDQYSCQKSYKKRRLEHGRVEITHNIQNEANEVNRRNLANNENASYQNCGQHEMEDTTTVPYDVRQNSAHILNSTEIPLNNEPKVPNPILDYTYIAVDNFYTCIEQLHDHMDLVRNGIQQLIDNFTHPRTVQLQDQEHIMTEFKQSIDMLQRNIELLRYSVYNLHPRVANMRYLLLPSRDTILEFSEYIQEMSVDFEHTRYFNNDSPMLTMLKMIVVINVIYSVTSRGRRAFLRSVTSDFIDVHEEHETFNLREEHKRFIRPTFNLLYRRTEAMTELRNLSGTLYQVWDQTGNWDTFLPSLHMFIRSIRALEPYFAVPTGWFVIRILPETRLMHVFDGFMSEFYRAIVTPNFANDNPAAFGAIFTVIKYILENIISQNVVILRDLHRMVEDVEGRADPFAEQPVEQNQNGIPWQPDSGRSAAEQRYLQLFNEADQTNHDYVNLQSDAHMYSSDANN